MSFKHHNITGEYTNELIAAGTSISITSISLANVEGTNECSVDLWIEKKLTGKFYYMKQVVIPANTSLSLDLSVDTAPGEWGLFIKLTKSASETPKVDVILN